MSDGPESPAPSADFLEAIRNGERRELARAITMLESGRVDQSAMGQNILEALIPNTGASVRLGITGPPGVGKSTMIEALGLQLVERGHRVAVLAVDPTSPVTGAVSSATRRAWKFWHDTRPRLFARRRRGRH